MKVSVLFYQRLLFVCAVLFAIIALVIIFGVIPPAMADTYPGVPHKLVAGVFLVITFLNLLSAFILFRITTSPKKRIGESKPVLIIIGILVILLGLVLTDGASAWQKHGSSMQFASILVFICAAVDFLAGVMVITSAFFKPKRD